MAPRALGPLWIGILVLVSAALAALAVQAWTGRRDAIAAGSRTTATLARLVDRHAVRILEGTDLLLRAAGSRALTLRPGGRGEQAADVTTDLASPFPHIRAIRTFDGRSGELLGRYERVSEVIPGIDQGALEAHRTQTGEDLQIGRPHRSEDGRWIVGVSRRIAGAADGRVVVVLAYFDLDAFQTVLEGLAEGRNAAIALFRTDGRLVARHPFDQAIVGQDFSGAPLFQELRKGPAATRDTVTDGNRRLVSHRHIAGTDLVVVVALAWEEVMASWVEETRRNGAIGGGMILMLAALGLVLSREARKGTRAEAERARQARQRARAQVPFRSLFDQVPDALMVYAVDPATGGMTLEARNDAAQALLDTGAMREAETWLREAHDTGRRITAIARDEGRSWEVVCSPLDDQAGGGAARILASAREVTHLKAAEAEAREANRMLRLAEQVAHVGHWRLTLADKAVFWSDEVFRIYGLDPAAGSPTIATALDPYIEPDRDRLRRVLDTAIASGEDFAVEAQIRRPDGTLRTVAIRGTCERNARGRTTAVFGTMIELTEFKRTETELREKTALLDATLESMDQGLIMVDENGIVRVCNANAIRMLDLDAAAMQARPAYVDVIADRQAKGEFAAADPALLSFIGKVAQAPARYERERPNGTVLEVRTVHLPQGGAVKTYTDVTERRRTERAASESQDLYRLLATSATDMIIRADLDSTRRYVSPACRELLGYEPEELIGTRPLDQVHPDDVPAFRQVLDDLALSAAEQAVSRQRYRRKDGTWVWVEGTFRLVRDADGTPTGYVAAVRDISDRKATEDAIAESEMRYRALADTLPQMIWVMRVEDGLAIYANRRFFEFYGPVGPQRRERVGRNHPDDAERIAQAWRTAQIRGEAMEVEGRLRRQDGVYRWHKLVMVPLIRDGEVKEWLGTALDIDEIVSAKEALKKTGDLLHLAQAGAGAGLFEWDLLTGLARLSPESRRLFGLPDDAEDEIGPDVWSRILDADDLNGVMAEAARAIETGSDYRAEFRVVRPDGSEGWLLGVGRVVKGSDGTAERIVGLNLDVTERRQAENATAASEARFRLLAENTSDLIILGHDDGRRSYISPASLQLLGFTPDEMHAMRLRDYVHPDDLPILMTATARLNAGERQISLDYRALHKERGWIWVEGVFRRVLNAKAGDPTIVAAFRDISERLAHAAELAAAKEAAERLQAAAEAASEAKSDFLASMSHEIRTPLNGILGYVDLLMQDPELAPGQRRYAERILSGGQALLTVVNDILDFSKIEAGEIELERQPFSAEVLIDNAVSIVRGMADQKGLTMSVSIDAGLPMWFVGDQDRIRQVLLNLLNNAVKFTPMGGITLQVTRLDTGGGAGGAPVRLRFAVSDTGIGIPQDKQARLFQRFSQVDGSIRREFGGTGLGLAISKNLVELMGGTIAVTSEQGKGSTFWFDLDLPPVDPAEDEATRTEAAPARAARTARILLVEDVEMNQELARAVLEGAGHSVDIVGDGADAIHAIQAKEYDLVLMDIQMPGMDGMTATRHIRALASPVSRIPIVALTANVLPHQVSAFRAAGMDDHVGKPFKRPDLLGTIARHLCDGPVVAMPASNPDLDPGADPNLDPLAASPVDEAIYEDIEQALGAAGMRTMLQGLADQTTDMLQLLRAVSDADRDGLASEVHKLVSSSGLLGFSRLSALCRALEEACAKADDEALRAAVTATAQAGEDALGEIARRVRADGRIATARAVVLPAEAMPDEVLPAKALG